MTERPVVVGMDGSEPSMAAVRWAAAEAALRKAPLRIVHARVWRKSNEQFSIGSSAQESWALDRIRVAWREAAQRHPGLRIDAEETTELPARALLDASAEGQLLVLGSRGVGRVTGFLTGSVALPVVAHARGPVVLVREERRGEEEAGDRRPSPEHPTPQDGSSDRSPIVVGVGLEHRYEPVLEFAFEAAARTRRPLRAVHVWTRSSLYAYPSALPDAGPVAEFAARARADVDAALEPWRRTYQEVTVEPAVLDGAAADRLLDASQGAYLLVVGRRVRTHVRLGTPLGPVANALLHHAPSPVAVVPHSGR